MTEDTPRIASTLERTKLFMAACLMLFEAPLIFHRKDSLGLLIFMGALFMSLHVVRVLSTQVSAVGISQLTWCGRIQMRWEDVTAVDRRDRSIVLTSDAGSVIVHTESFYDTQAAMKYLDAHLPNEFRQK